MDSLNYGVKAYEEKAGCRKSKIKKEKEKKKCRKMEKA